MACDLPKQEWTIDILIDGRPDKAVIVFCLNVENGIITGEVSDLTSGVPIPLSPVTGISLPIPELGLDPPTLMTLNFTWDAARVILWGHTFRQSLNKFSGRFAAFQAPAVNGAPNRADGTLAGPGDGDTGTGTGTQT